MERYAVYYGKKVIFKQHSACAESSIYFQEIYMPHTLVHLFILKTKTLGIMRRCHYLEHDRVRIISIVFIIHSCPALIFLGDFQNHIKAYLHSGSTHSSSCTFLSMKEIKYSVEIKIVLLFSQPSVRKAFMI